MLVQQFILLRASEEAIEHSIGVLKMLLGNSITVKPYNNFTCVYYNGSSSKEIIDSIKSLESDLNTTISLYVSSKNSTVREIELVSKLFIRASFGYYTFKELLYKSRKVENSNAILNYIIEGTGIDEKVIRTMAMYNLNVSKAAVELYMHRNTLLYKIDRLLTLKDFDLKCFIDLFILLKLVES